MVTPFKYFVLANSRQSYSAWGRNHTEGVKYLGQHATVNGGSFFGPKVTYLLEVKSITLLSVIVLGQLMSGSISEKLTRDLNQLISGYMASSAMLKCV